MRNFELNLEDAVDDGHAIATLIGPNGGGKSRVLHALAEIFGALHRPKHRTAFAFDAHYVVRGKTVRVLQASPDASPGMTVAQAGREPTRVPRADWAEHLPYHVFGYQAHPRAPWTGEFDQHRRFAAQRLGDWRRQWRQGLQEWLDSHTLEDSWPEQLTLPISCPLYTPIFLCTPAHLPLLLLSQTTHWSDSFGAYLREQSYIQHVASAVLRVRAPRAAREMPLAALPYWGLGGPARTLFAAAAESGRFGLIPDADPVNGAGSPADGFRIVLGTTEDVKAFRNLFDSDLSMFGLLATLLDAGYLTVDIRLQRTGTVTLDLDDLSSGEQQILTILGLLHLQRAQESLFLLDEPDSHFHPEWSRRWYSSVRIVLGEHHDSQFIAATHEPLLVANMTRQQIRVVSTGEEGRTKAVTPRADPRGQGAGGLLTTDLFGLPTQLDEHTQGLIDQQYELLAAAPHDSVAQAELRRVTGKLDALGFSTANRDPLVSAFLAELHSRRRALVEAARGTSPPSPEVLEALVAELFNEHFSSVL
ncbi:AAA family ATPase [Sphaerisporangium siamense]|uniref:Putative ATPase/transposase-like protein n=1 Tax=Sphaerisporangium siamense TaxID=795645 RepID=A0A7W7G7I5_9ACTN|nr:AAA family ATPase [Sphaerisporangium siamense]MBB4700643.1 putative ATPase/transposase-like protein [Sphaerisporangium siamense]